MTGKFVRGSRGQKKLTDSVYSSYKDKILPYSKIITPLSHASGGSEKAPFLCRAWKPENEKLDSGKALSSKFPNFSTKENQKNADSNQKINLWDERQLKN